VSAPPALESAVETFWRERALRAEADNTALKKRLAETETRLAELTEQVAVLSRMPFGRSSEKTPAGPAAPAGGDGQPPSPAGADRPRPKRGQRPGSKGHGRRDHSGLRTREEIHDVPADQRTRPWCGRAFEGLGAECGERIDRRAEDHQDRAPPPAVPAPL
jgi:transposase